MTRCWGITRNLHRCNRTGDWEFFCHEHNRQWIVWLFSLVFTVLAGTLTIANYFSSSSETPKVDAKQGVAAGRDIKGSTITIAPLREDTHDTSTAKEN